jgi:hypothetical protein
MNFYKFVFSPDTSNNTENRLCRNNQNIPSLCQLYFHRYERGAQDCAKTSFSQTGKILQRERRKFQAVDLRWGVNEESQLNQKNLDISD